MGNIISNTTYAGIIESIAFLAYVTKSLGGLNMGMHPGLMLSPTFLMVSHIEYPRHSSECNFSTVLTDGIPQLKNPHVLNIPNSTEWHVLPHVLQSTEHPPYY